MSEEQSRQEQIIGALKDRACSKQNIFRQTIEVYEQLREQIHLMAKEVNEAMAAIDKNVVVEAKDYGKYETQLKFSGDILIFSMHTNIFNFDDNHSIRSSAYVRQEEQRAYCGMIQIHNFLADSYKFNRLNDMGYLIGRMFVNFENHYFLEGKGQLGFLYNEFAENVVSKDALKNIVESAMLYTIDFDLLVPPYNQVNQVSVAQQIAQRGTTAFKTGKRVGFQFSLDADQEN